MPHISTSMAATAQDPSAPLRGPEKKDEDRDDESTCLGHYIAELSVSQHQWHTQGELKWPESTERKGINSDSNGNVPDI